MDDYTTPGVYLTATQAIAQSLSHYPTNRSSKIIVEYQNSTSRIMQTVITTYTPWEIHRRIAEYTNGAYVWRDWYQEPMRDEITALNNSIASRFSLNIPSDGSKLSASTAKDALTEAWSQIPSSGLPIMLVLKATGGDIMCFGFKYSGSYGAFFHGKYSGQCGCVTVNNNTFTDHAI